MMQPIPYFQRQIESIDKLVKEFEDSKKKDNGENIIAQVLATIIRDRLQELKYNAVEIDYKTIEEKIKPYL